MPVMTSGRTSVADALREAAYPLAGAAGDYGPLSDLIGEAPLVLLGEASHGTHGFYVEWARITQHLMEDEDFSAVAVQADWPDASRVHCYARCADASAASGTPVVRSPAGNPQ